MIWQGWSILLFTLKRMATQIDLTFAAILGMTSAAVLMISVPLYTDAVYSRILQTEMSDAPRGEQAGLSILFHVLGNGTQPLTLEAVEQANSYFSTGLISDLGVQNLVGVRFVKTPRFGLFPQDSTTYRNPLARLTTIQLAWLDGLPDQISLLEGNFPASQSGDGVLEVLLSERIAAATGIQVGESYVIFAEQSGRSQQARVRIAGIWRATAPYDPFWFRPPTAFDDLLFVSEESFFGPVAALTQQVDEALWHIGIPSAAIHIHEVDAWAARMRRVQQISSALLPGLIITSPLERLQRYQTAAQTLTRQLFVFSLPLLGLTLIFIGLVNGMTIQRRRNEIAVLRSRGASRGQIVTSAALEGLLIGLVAAILAVPGGMLVANIAMTTRDFLDFSGVGEMGIAFNPSAAWTFMAVVGLSLITQTLPSISASQQTIVTYKQERARLRRPPLWQRIGVDFLLLLASLYGAYLLKQQGGVFVADGPMHDPFENPLLFLTPSLTLFALALIIVRFLPYLLGALAKLTARTASVGFLLTVRYLSRAPGLYTGPLVLLITSLALSLFLASTARTLGNHLYDQMWYRAGADLIVQPVASPSLPVGSAETQDSVMTLSTWYTIPRADYLPLSGVIDGARVGRYPGRFGSTGRQVDATLLAVERSTLANVAYWRADFAAETLGALMNRLASLPNAVLIPAEFMQTHAIQPGDPIRVSADIYGMQTDLTLIVVGAFDLFPTWHPRWGPLFVIDLNDLIREIGMDPPTATWLRLEPGMEHDAAKAEIQALNPLVTIQSPYFAGLVDREAAPAHQGLLGLFSIGFISTALLASVGFFLYMIYSFRRRAVELGILRSIGLSYGQMTGHLLWELLLLVQIGIGGGTLLGWMVSRLWIPDFVVGTDSYAELLPMPVNIAWQSVQVMYIVFASFFALSLGTSILLSQRLRLFEIVKMGEST